MNFRKEISEKLNNLLQNNLNTHEVYEKAFENSKNTELHAFFKHKMEQRSGFIKELRNEILRYGQIPEDEADFSTTLKTTWLDFKSLFSNTSQESMLEACLEADKKALEEYKELAKERDLPPTIDAIIANHSNQIQNAINKDKMYLESAII
ncbi:PA2169 family four-helix-bundle protein [Aquimarina sp. ERC-38]|uniref:PA2169 family four-helix-bundle protein n=1 Tax=Aquimarina sp. ERC-38 TaxID=2949996 RepID=UPI00224591AF|nr:PA2169 family four-helix-bundle protein [Aquimarina sp. ERC-38]UZO81519.1 PA2169 family four-helix-bundle protein [Aquimarina sp. ERC-38]